MRAEVAALQEATRAQEYFYRQVKTKLDCLEWQLIEWDRDIAYMLGTHSAFRREPTTMRVQDVRSFRRMPTPDDMEAAMRVVDVVSLTAAVAFVNMKKFIVAAWDDRIELRSYIRLKLEDEKGEWRYCISDQMWHDIGLAPRDVEELSIRIAHDLVRLVQKERVAA